MYAIIETGGKQYRIENNSKIYVEKLNGAPGDEIVIDKVLFVGGGERIVGTPYIDGAKVTTEILMQNRRPKVLVFKRRRRKDSKTMHGHRQDCTVLRIKEISLKSTEVGSAEETAPESIEQEN